MKASIMLLGEEQHGLLMAEQLETHSHNFIAAESLPSVIVSAGDALWTMPLAQHPSVHAGGAFNVHQRSHIYDGTPSSEHQPTCYYW